MCLAQRLVVVVADVDDEPVVAFGDADGCALAECYGDADDASPVSDDAVGEDVVEVDVLESAFDVAGAGGVELEEEDGAAGEADAAAVVEADGADVAGVEFGCATAES